MPEQEPIDETDRRILDRLRQNARESSESIASHVGLTGGAVRRRISTLEKRGVIAGYTVVIGHDAAVGPLEAYVELSFAGDTNVHDRLRQIIERPEVREAMTLAGSPDALLRVRVRDTTELRDLVMSLRESGPVKASKTLMVIGRWWHGSVERSSS